jgi:tetratricopeptide (TPR) repeat protein
MHALVNIKGERLMKEKKIINFPKQYNECIEQEYFGDSDDDFDGCEEWEGDYFYYNKEDWKGLIKYREQVAKNYPKDSEAQWRLGEAYVLNNEFEKALEFLSKLHYKEPDNVNVQYSILDAIFGLNKAEDDFNWIERPSVIRLNEKTLDICYDLLKPKRKPKEVGFLHVDLYSYGYLTFNEDDLIEALIKDARFSVAGEGQHFSDKYVSVNRSGIRKK